MCGSGSCIDLRVTSGDPTVMRVDQLDLRVLGAASFTGKTVELGSPVPLPVTTDVAIPADRTGNVWVAVGGLIGGGVVGEGVRGTAVKQGGHQALEVALTSKAPRRVFLLAPHDGALGGQKAADALCAGEAQAAGLAGNFTALLGFANVVGPAMTASLPDGDREIVLPNAALVSSDASFLQPNHIAPIEMLANKTMATANCVWTNFDGQGAARGADCSGWTSKLVGERGNYGEPDHADVNWSDFGGSRTCDALCHVYCLEQ